MEMEPQDAARFEEIIRLNALMEGVSERINAQLVSDRVKKARLRAVKRDAEARQRELDAMVVKYENHWEPFAEVLDFLIFKLQAKLAKLG
jgi:hypothetical protein